LKEDAIPARTVAGVSAIDYDVPIAGIRLWDKGVSLKEKTPAAGLLAGSEAPRLLPGMLSAGTLKLAVLKQNSVPDADSIPGIRYGL
jgi:hypothetical protein